MVTSSTPFLWRFFWDYGNSELGNQGVHMLDVGMWAIEKMRGLDNCLPRRISSNGGIYWLSDAKKVPDTQIVTYDNGDMMLVWECRASSNTILSKDLRRARHSTEPREPLSSTVMAGM